MAAIMKQVNIDSGFVLRQQVLPIPGRGGRQESPSQLDRKGRGPSTQ